jgi:hypothetical protein
VGSSRETFCDEWLYSVGNQEKSVFRFAVRRERRERQGNSYTKPDLQTNYEQTLVFVFRLGV